MSPTLAGRLSTTAPPGKPCMLSFDFVMVSSAVQKLLSLIRSHLFIFDFIYFNLKDSKNIATIYVKKCYAYVFF